MRRRAKAKKSSPRVTGSQRGRSCTGPHNGRFFGIAPTGRQVVQEQIHLIRFANGKGVEHRAVRDDLGLLRQLGVVPDHP
jgi:predicted ester cyclase